MARARLPPLNAIKAFEAAARLGSFTRAAEELSVTHGAVSRQIRLLEEWLGTSLFMRTSRNAVPTRAGRELLAEAGPALDRLAGATLRVQSSGKASGVLHISALPTFAMRWLIPRLPELQRIGIGGHLAMPPLPHHRAYGSVPRRFDWVKLGRRRGVGEDRVSRSSDCAGLVGPPGVRTCARTPSVNQRRPLH